MTREEFSNGFTTLLNSYNTQANFGEEASKQEVVLDEYEKSVLLTQAQDRITKSYFDARLNSQGQGMDDSARRQVDFSSLITTATLQRSNDQTSKFDDRGIIYDLPTKTVNGVNSTNVLFILNEKMVDVNHVNEVFNTVTINDVDYTFGIASFSDKKIQFKILFTSEAEHQAPEITEKENKVIIDCKISRLDSKAFYNYWRLYLRENTFKEYMNYIKPIGAGSNSGAWPSTPVDLSGYSSTITLFADPTSAAAKQQLKTTNYVVVPISYKEYDREMSKPYAQPLKKQAWRLFQNQSTGFDLKSELIPRFNIKENTNTLQYKIRYVRRPVPIVLEDLPDNLSIDGYSTAQDCELNPILHYDILEEAVRMAIATRGAAPQRTQRENG